MQKARDRLRYRSTHPALSFARPPAAQLKVASRQCRLEHRPGGQPYMVQVPAQVWHHWPPLHTAWAEAPLHTQDILVMPSVHIGDICIWPLCIIGWCIMG